MCDEMIIVNEMIYSMKKMKGRKGLLSIKLDLEKAYDEEDFLKLR